MDGVARPGFASASDDVFGALPFLEASLDIVLTQTAGVRVGGSAGLPLPTATVTFAGREVATWGSPLFGIFVTPWFGWMGPSSS
jgi:hypothetical protein